MRDTIIAKDLKQAILNWQNAVGSEHDGQLEAFLSMSLGFMRGMHDSFKIGDLLTPEQTTRVNKLLSDNHHTMIKTWMARNE